VEISATVGQATRDDVKWRMPFVCRITKVIDLCHGNIGYENTPQFYVIRALPILFIPLTKNWG